jgi:hypothetical protein
MAASLVKGLESLVKKLKNQKPETKLAALNYKPQTNIFSHFYFKFLKFFVKS